MIAIFETEMNQDSYNTPLGSIFPEVFICLYPKRINYYFAEKVMNFVRNEIVLFCFFIRVDRLVDEILIKGRIEILLSIYHSCRNKKGTSKLKKQEVLVGKGDEMNG
ncbi:hypothetical protein A5888_001282 [Enterococcus sp. 9E7_DIV0242]|uniref:Uncharacterized protein n=1 Tax=Candidatus Enterococcus clewellii TaxID=1834193 RepID=A0A242K250_9ENTE|nr:hypothetical protein A5888_003248 [Enterococcus sp. 9E7_DIV0242]